MIDGKHHVNVHDWRRSVGRGATLVQRTRRLLRNLSRTPEMPQERQRAGVPERQVLRSP